MRADDKIQVRRRDLSEFCSRNHIKKLSLFGSALTDEFRPDSDIDLLVEFEEGRAPGLRFFDMQDELSSLFGRRVDVNTPGFLSPRVRERILRRAEVLYERA